MNQVFIKAYKRFGKLYPAQATEFSVVVEKNNITIFKSKKQGSSFKVGGIASHGGYNFVYLGEISKITDKTVTIIEYKGTLNERTHRLDMYDFCWKNYGFDIEEINKQNHETSRCI